MNSIRLMSFMKHALLIVALLTIVGISGCDDGDDGPSVFNGTVMDLIQDARFKQSTTVTADNALDSLVKYINVNPDLVATLSGTSDVTLFAPSNTAFISLLATPGFPAKITDINPNVIKGVLAYHIVMGKLQKSALTPTGSGAGLTSLYSDVNACSGASTAQVIKVNDNGTLLTGSTNAAIEFQKADNLATNGVVHVTKTVLIPPTVGASLTPILGKLSATVLLASNFSHLAKAMTKADCGVPGVTPLSSLLSAAGPYTAFLPPNAVFEGTAAAQSKTVDQLIAMFTAEQWRNIILNHIVSGTKNLASLTNATQLTTSIASGTAKLTVTDVPVSSSTPKGKILSTSGGTTGLGGTLQSPILVSDVAASNGVAHVVGKILIPN